MPHPGGGAHNYLNYEVKQIAQLREMGLCSIGIENNIHLPQIPIVNYASDVEHEEDFGNGWEWTEKDPGSSCGPFISQPGLLIEPPSHTPEDFFNLLFDNSMWTLLAQQTNIYARQRIQQLRGIILDLFLLYFCLQNMFLNPLLTFPIFSWSFTSNSLCKLDVLWHYSHTFCMNC